MTTNYKELIASAKNAARDVLRAEKVNALLGYIASVENDIKDLNERKSQASKSLARREYEVRVATHFESPDLKEMTDNLAKFVTDHNKHVEAIDEEIKAREGKIAEYNTKIDNWYNGTSKVDAERLNELALQYVKDKVGTDFNMGLYSESVNA